MTLRKHVLKHFSVTDRDIERLLETVDRLLPYAEDEAALTCDNEENSEKAWDAADKARDLLQEIKRKRSEAVPMSNCSILAKDEHGLEQTEGRKPDLTFNLLQIAERSCSLLEDWVQLAGVRDETLTDQTKETRALLETQRPTWSVGARDLLTERRRQVQEKGYTPERDDTYTRGQLADAASAYAFLADVRAANPAARLDYLKAKPPSLWPWGPEQWKPASQRLMLIKAGALILAELDRLDRMESREAHHD